MQNYGCVIWILALPLAIGNIDKIIEEVKHSQTSTFKFQPFDTVLGIICPNKGLHPLKHFIPRRNKLNSNNFFCKHPDSSFFNQQSIVALLGSWDLHVGVPFNLILPDV